MSDMIDRVAWAINTAWTRCGDVPFPLYQHEAEALAAAAIEAMRQAETQGLSFPSTECVTTENKGEFK